MIPRKLKRRRTAHSQYFWHYEIIPEKCTKKLVIYRCIETGCLEAFQKKELLTKKYNYDLRHIPKYERGSVDDTECEKI